MAGGGQSCIHMECCHLRYVRPVFCNSLGSFLHKGALNLESRSVVRSLIVSIFPLAFIVFHFILFLLLF